MQKSIEQRINRTIGQLEALKRELNKQDYDCEKIIVQLKAVVGSSQSLGRIIAENELRKCLATDIDNEEKLVKIKSVLAAAF